MITFSLQSGSNGNAIYVEAGGIRLLIDAGISGKLAEGRMRVHGRDIRDVHAVLISHDHSDHVRCAGVYQRRYHLPIYISRPTFHAVNGSLGQVSDIRYFQAGQTLCFNGVTVHTIPTPHDATDGVVFVIEHEGKRLGILTDLGHAFPGLYQLLESLDAAYIESNYDPDMLENGPYPWHLQQRIRGPGGHLSNAESADLIKAAGLKLRWAALAHLSHENNHPDLAFETHRRRIGQYFPLHLASRYDVTPVMEV